MGPCLSSTYFTAWPHLRPRARWHAGGGRDDALEGSSPLAARRASHHNLVFGGPGDPNHDAVLRIGWRNSEVAGPFFPSALQPSNIRRMPATSKPSSATCFHARRTVVKSLRLSCS